MYRSSIVFLMVIFTVGLGYAQTNNLNMTEVLRHCTHNGAPVWAGGIPVKGCAVYTDPSGRQFYGRDTLMFDVDSSWLIRYVVKLVYPYDTLYSDTVDLNITLDTSNINDIYLCDVKLSQDTAWFINCDSTGAIDSFFVELINDTYIDSMLIVDDTLLCLYRVNKLGEIIDTVCTDINFLPFFDPHRIVFTNDDGELSIDDIWGADSLSLFNGSYEVLRFMNDGASLRELYINSEVTILDIPYYATPDSVLVIGADRVVSKFPINLVGVQSMFASPDSSNLLILTWPDGTPKDSVDFFGMMSGIAGNDTHVSDIWCDSDTVFVERSDTSGIVDTLFIAGIQCARDTCDLIFNFLTAYELEVSYCGVAVDTLCISNTMLVDYWINEDTIFIEQFTTCIDLSDTFHVVIPVYNDTMICAVYPGLDSIYLVRCDSSGIIDTLPLELQINYTANTNDIHVTDYWINEDTTFLERSDTSGILDTLFVILPAAVDTDVDSMKLIGDTLHLWEDLVHLTTDLNTFRDNDIHVSDFWQVDDTSFIERSDTSGILDTFAVQTDIHIGNSNLTTTNSVRTLTLLNDFFFRDIIEGYGNLWINVQDPYSVLQLQSLDDAHFSLRSDTSSARITVRSDGVGDVLDYAEIRFMKGANESDPPVVAQQYTFRHTWNGDFQLLNDYTSGFTAITDTIISILNSSQDFNHHTDVFLLEVPPLDNTQNYFLVRDSVTGQIELRNTASIFAGGPDSTMANADLIMTDDHEVNFGNGLSWYWFWDNGSERFWSDNTIYHYSDLGLVFEITANSLMDAQFVGDTSYLNIDSKITGESALRLRQGPDITTNYWEFLMDINDDFSFGYAGTDIITVDNSTYDIALPQLTAVDNTIDSVLVRDNITGIIKLRTAASLAAMGSEDHDWYETGTTTPPTVITQNKWTNGLITIGTEHATIDYYKLQVITEGQNNTAFFNPTSHDMIVSFIADDGASTIDYTWNWRILNDIFKLESAPTGQYLHAIHGYDGVDPIFILKDDGFLQATNYGIGGPTGTLNATLGVEADGDIIQFDLSALLHDPVTMSGVPDYITLVGQDIVRDSIDLVTDVKNDSLTLRGTNPTLIFDDTDLGSQDYSLRTEGAVFRLRHLGSSTDLVYVDSDGRAGLGAMAPNETKLYVYGGSNGANIDARSDSDINPSTIELQPYNYTTTLNSVYLQYVGDGMPGNIFGSIPYADLMQLAFMGDNALIYTQNTAPLIFGTDFEERFRISGTTGISTFLFDVVVPYEAYGISWDGSFEVPTKDALYDIIEAETHDPVTLAGTPDYITISGQVITRNQIDLVTDITGSLPVANNTTFTSHRLLFTDATTGKPTVNGTWNATSGMSLFNNTVSYLIFRSSNIAIGGGTVASTSDNRSTIIGHVAGGGNSSRTTTLGYGAGAGLAFTNLFNTLIGYGSGGSLSDGNPFGASYNTFIGYSSGEGVSTGSGNIMINGYASAVIPTGITGGANNIILGYYTTAISNANLNIFIGNNAGTNLSGGSKFAINNSAASVTADNKFMWGDMSTDELFLNSTVTIRDIPHYGTPDSVLVQGPNGEVARFHIDSISGSGGGGGGDHDEVTLAGTPNYITISGQVITRHQIDLADDVTGLLPDGNITNSGNWNTAFGWGDHSTAGYLTAPVHFANTDLTANANRLHDFDEFDLTIFDIGDLSLTAIDDIVLETTGVGTDIYLTAVDRVVAGSLVFVGSLADPQILSSGDLTILSAGTGELLIGTNGIVNIIDNTKIGGVGGQQLEIVSSASDVRIGHDEDFATTYIGFNNADDIILTAGSVIEITNLPVLNNVATDVLVRNNATGHLEYRQASSIGGGMNTNFALDNLTADADRTHDFAGFYLSIEGLDSLSLHANDSIFLNSANGSIVLNSPTEDIILQTGSTGDIYLTTTAVGPASNADVIITSVGDDVLISALDIIGLEADNAIRITNLPALDNAATDILVRNSTTGSIEYREVSSILGIPAGSTGEIQFNNAGVFGADSELFWDAANKIFAIGPSNTPAITAATKLYLNDAGNLHFQIESNDGGSVQLRLKSNHATLRRILSEDGSGGVKSQMSLEDDSYKFYGPTTATNPLNIYTDGTNNIGINAINSFGTSAVGVLGIGIGTAPTTSPANMIQLYVEDVGASAELKVRDEAGNITVLSDLTGSSPAGSTGEIQFNNAGAFGASSNLFFQNSPVRLGLGTSSPAHQFHSHIASGANHMIVQSGTRFLSYFASTALDPSLYWTTGTHMKLGVATSNIGAGYTINHTFTSNGDIIFGTATAVGTSGTRVLAMGNGTAPTTAPADMIQLWSADVTAGQAQLFARGESGNAEQLTSLAIRTTATWLATSTTSLFQITGFNRQVEAGKTYEFEAILYTTSNAAAGVKASIAGTASATSIIYEGYLLNANTVAGQARGTALNTAVAAVTAVTAATIYIKGTIVVNAAGLIGPAFAQNVSSATSSSVLPGSTFKLTPLSN